MKIFVLTCDRYSHLINGFSLLFNHHWRLRPKVTVLGFSPPYIPESARDNFSFVSMAERETKAWSDHVLAYFSSIQDDQFLLLLDDYWLSGRPDLEMMVKLHTLVENRVFMKADLSISTEVQACSGYGGDHRMVISAPGARYKTSLQPAVWNRVFFLSQLRRGLSPWQFELQAQPRERVIGARGGVLRYVNFYRKGKVNPRAVEMMPWESMELLRKGRAL